MKKENKFLFWNTMKWKKFITMEWIEAIKDNSLLEKKRRISISLCSQQNIERLQIAKTLLEGMVWFANTSEKIAEYFKDSDKQTSALKICEVFSEEVNQGIVMGGNCFSCLKVNSPPSSSTYSGQLLNLKEFLLFALSFDSFKKNGCLVLCVWVKEPLSPGHPTPCPEEWKQIESQKLPQVAV